MKKFNDNEMDNILKSLKLEKAAIVPAGFTGSVMDRIRRDMTESVGALDTIYLKFAIAASFVAAASVLLAVNAFMSYTPTMEEFAMAGFLGESIF